MLKKLLTIALALLLVFTATACGGGKEDGNGDDGDFVSIKAQHLDLGENFDERYYPVSSEIEQRSGTIDVVILFESTETAWEALAEEYMRLHSNAVTVNIGVDGVQNNYQNRLDTELNNPKTTWDIVQGNLVNNISSKCFNMSSAINRKNAYAGNVAWKNVLTTNAYQTDSAGSNSTFILNSQNLQTAWFINTVAFDAANAEAAKDGVTLKSVPETWDELIEICKYMQKAGYTYPLGIALEDSSVKIDQFSWLLRVYGDYYYRNEYDIIMKDPNYKVDVTSENPEADVNYGYQETKLYNVILDETSEYYRGAKSDKYKEFVGQFAKMKDYIHADAAQRNLQKVRDTFKTQVDGKDSPQIILDYAGSGLTFNDAEGFSADFFDYPVMTSEGGYIKENTLLRDVGGNGGYLSILNHDAKQNQLNLDFLKFVMSPYGQTIFYNALSKTEYAPQGITTVKNDLVLVPEKWADFFKTDKITFTGLSDSNEFVKNLVRYLAGDQTNMEKSVVIWRDLLKKNGGISVDAFASEWQESLLTAWDKYAAQQRWKTDCYKTWGGETN